MVNVNNLTFADDSGTKILIAIQAILSYNGSYEVKIYQHYVVDYRYDRNQLLDCSASCTIVY